MEDSTFEVFDARIKTPFSLIVAGPSNCGKTTFVSRLIANENNIIDKPFDYILWFYGEKTEKNKYLKNDDRIRFIHGLPDSFDSFISPSSNGLAVFDDLMMECSNNKLITQFFTRRSHHENISVIFITQNLFYEGKERKNFARNATYLTIFNSPLDQTIAYSLAPKLMPRKQKTFMEIYNHAVNKPHGYLFIDGHQSTPKNARFRSEIFGAFQRVLTPL